jgi:hypothetical protein
MANDTRALVSNNAADGAKARLMTLDDLDGRSLAAKAAKSLIMAMQEDLGGADRLSAAERAIVHRSAVITAMVEDMETRWLAGGDLDVGAYSSLTNVLRRLLATIGLQRRQRDVTPELHDYIAERTATVSAAEPVDPEREAQRARAAHARAARKAKQAKPLPPCPVALPVGGYQA